MMSTSNLYFLHRSLDRSVALSMNLTSYVSNFRPEDFRGRDITFQRFRDPEPRDGLDQFIRAWEANDRESFEATLGPNARIALQGLLDGRTWADMREELWRGKAGDILGLGYQFETSGIWSESEEMLDQEFDAYKEHLRYPVNPETDTLFKNSAGVECGHYRIKLIQASRRSNVLYPPYLIDNRDLGDLLRLIVSCCVEISKKP